MGSRSKLTVAVTVVAALMAAVDTAKMGPPMRIISKKNQEICIAASSAYGGLAMPALCDGLIVGKEWLTLKWKGRHDSEGFAVFALVNNHTKRALESVGNQLQLTKEQISPSSPYNASIAWSTSKNMGDRFTTIRTAENVHWNIMYTDHEMLVLSAWNKNASELWKFTPY